MKNLTLLICLAVLSAFGQIQEQIIVREGETRILRGQRFENFSGDFVIKNFGFLIIENCTIQNNILGGTNAEAEFSDEKRVVAPIINFGRLEIGNSVFVNNFSRNNTLTNDFSAQVSAGVIANFGELTLSDDNTFENNSFQRGRFSIVRNEGIQQISYIGDDNVFNGGTIQILTTERFENVERNNLEQNNLANLEISAEIVRNPVPLNENARISIRTNRQTTVRISIFNMLGSVVHSAQAEVENKHTFVWNLRAGSSRESSYTVRIEAENFVENIQLGVRR